jgi:hypothetical protein
MNDRVNRRHWQKMAGTCVAALCCIGAAWAGPMGLEMGTSLAELRKHHQLHRVAPYQYSATGFKGGHADFVSYRLLVTPVHGLCRFAAWSKPLRTGGQGRELRERFNGLHAALTEKYGDGEISDSIAEDSLWGDPRDWMLALDAQDRKLSAVWLAEGQAMADHVAQVHLEAQALGYGRARLSLGYAFSNADECVAWIRAKRDGKL